MDTWARGRTAPVGDAAAAAALVAGEGSGLAMAEAYLLAGELHRSGGDFRSAFAQRTGLGLSVRDAVTGLPRIPLIAKRLIGRDLRDDIQLPDYGF